MLSSETLPILIASQQEREFTSPHSLSLRYQCISYPPTYHDTSDVYISHTISLSHSLYISVIQYHYPTVCIYQSYNIIISHSLYISVIQYHYIPQSVYISHTISLYPTVCTFHEHLRASLGHIILLTISTYNILISLTIIYNIYMAHTWHIHGTYMAHTWHIHGT